MNDRLSRLAKDAGNPCGEEPESVPMFFFETFDGEVCHGDKNGMDLPSDREARLEALSALPDMARDKIPDGDFRIFRTLVRDHCGEVVYEASMTLTGRWKKAQVALD